MKEGFEDNSESVKKDIADSVAIGLTECAIQLEGEIALRTPVDTGHLRNSISFIAPLASSLDEKDSCYTGKPGTRVHKGQTRPGKCREEEHPGRLQGSADMKTAYVGTNVEYAEYVEYGTKRMKAQPYMRTGLSAATPALREIFRRRMMTDGK